MVGWCKYYYSSTIIIIYYVIYIENSIYQKIQNTHQSTFYTISITTDIPVSRYKYKYINDDDDDDEKTRGFDY